MRVIVTGSRDHANRHAVWAALTDVLREAWDTATNDTTGPILTLVHGSARGADTFAHQWAVAHDPVVVPELHIPDWKMGKQAGHWRNQHMVNLGADLLLAFFQPGAANAGTADCVARAVEAGIPVRRYPQEPAITGLEADETPLLQARLDKLRGQQ